MQAEQGRGGHEGAGAPISRREAVAPRSTQRFRYRCAGQRYRERVQAEKLRAWPHGCRQTNRAWVGCAGKEGAVRQAGHQTGDKQARGGKTGVGRRHLTRWAHSRLALLGPGALGKAGLWGRWEQATTVDGSNLQAASRAAAQTQTENARRGTDLKQARGKQARGKGKQGQERMKERG